MKWFDRGIFIERVQKIGNIQSTNDTFNKYTIFFIVHVTQYFLRIFCTFIHLFFTLRSVQVEEEKGNFSALI